MIEAFNYTAFKRTIVMYYASFINVVRSYLWSLVVIEYHTHIYF
jgi:hypothetical protein